MKIIFDSNIIVDLGKNCDFNEGKIEKLSAQKNFISKHKKDIESEIGAFKAIMKRKDFLEERIRTYLDCFGGTGLTASIAKKYLNPQIMYLNDLDKGCYDILIKNFPEHKEKIYNLDVFDFNCKETFDLTMLDFNNFTLNQIYFWYKVLLKFFECSKCMIIADSFCFGKKFGEKNLKGYRLATWEQYYELCQDIFWRLFGFDIKGVYFFKTNACALLFLKKSEKKGEFIEYFTPDIEPISIIHKDGGFLF